MWSWLESASSFWYISISIRSICVGHRNADIPQEAKGVQNSQDTLAYIFIRIENLFRRLEIYIEVSAMTAMTDNIIQIMVEVLHIIRIATKEFKANQISM